MVYFENAGGTVDLKPSFSYRHMDNTFVVWNNGKDNLDHFLTHLKVKHEIYYPNQRK